MSEKRLVSVVLPVYNGEDMLARSIESVLGQTYKNLELIIVNDCSTDNTAKIIEKYSSLDPRIKVVNNSVNLKLPRSLNAGFDNASGYYYTWTSHDNMYKDNAISVMVETLEAKPEFDMVYADSSAIDVNEKILLIKSANITRNFFLLKIMITGYA